MKYVRTFRLDRLYNQFLKSRGIPIEKLPSLITQLYENQFIDLIQADDLTTERYAELEKLTDRQHRDQLFKIVTKLGKP